MQEKCDSYPSISLIIPAYNEEERLPILLDTVDEARKKYEGKVEVIVSDNSSTDRTSEIAKERGRRLVTVEKRCIAAARNGGAAIAEGEIIAFIDADSKIHSETFNAIAEKMVEGKTVYGASGVRLDRMSLGIAAAHMVMIPLVWITGMDTGVVFSRREDFEAIGGYDEEIRFAEDVDIHLRMKKHGKKTKRKLCRLKGVKAWTSTRKFDRFGDWHYVLMIIKMFFWVIFSKKSMEKFADRYWYYER